MSSVQITPAAPTKIIKIDIKDGNLRNLMEIQRVILIEEGQDISLDETLARLLAFYREFVQYE